MGKVINFRPAKPTCKLVQQSEIEREIDALRKASNASPTDVLAKAKLADAIFKNGDWDQAYTLYIKCSDLQPLNWKFPYFAGLCLTKLNGNKQALVLFAKANNLPKSDFNKLSSAILFCLSKLKS